MKTTNSAAAITALCVGLGAAVAGAGAAQDLPLLQRDVSGAKGSTVSGCVGRGAGTGTYTLTPAATKDAGSPAADEQLFTIVLTGMDGDLAAHVGHIVSVTGSYSPAVGPAGTAAAGSGTAKPAPGTAAGKAAKAVRTFTVKSLKMVAASCSQAPAPPG
jgi:hypothetical protein